MVTNLTSAINIKRIESELDFLIPLSPIAVCWAEPHRVHGGGLRERNPYWTHSAPWVVQSRKTVGCHRRVLLARPQTRRFQHAWAKRFGHAWDETMTVVC